MSISIEEAKQRFAHWRRHKQSVREAIPEDLWQMAVELCQLYPKSTVVKALKLNLNGLNSRLYHKPKNLPTYPDSSSGFVELKLSDPVHSPVHRIEIERYDGHRMTLCASANQSFNLQEVMSSFLGASNASTERPKQNLFSS